MMSNELYMSFYEMYGVDTFKKIAESEAKHMEAVQALFDRYNIETPENYNHIQSLYEELKAKWSLSLKDALEVWLKIEIVDIDDIYTAIISSDNNDIRTVLVNIGWASYNHMRGFVKALANNDLTTDIDYSDYLTESDIDTKGPIKVKLAEKLEANGVELPEKASSEYIREKCKKEKAGNYENEEKDHGKKDWERGSEMRESKKENKKEERNNDRENINKYTNNSLLKAKYKRTYEVKYGSVISSMDDSKLETFIGKIDDVLEKVENGDYSDTTKQKYNAMLIALKEIATDNLDKGEILDGLFN